MTREGATRRCGTGTYANVRKVAFRIDSDTHWVEELGAGADAVVEAFAAAGKRGGLSAREVDLPDAMVIRVLTCIGRSRRA